MYFYKYIYAPVWRFYNCCQLQCHNLFSCFLLLGCRRWFGCQSGRFWRRWIRRQQRCCKILATRQTKARWVRRWWNEKCSRAGESSFLFPGSWSISATLQVTRSRSHNFSDHHFRFSWSRFNNLYKTPLIPIDCAICFPDGQLGCDETNNPSRFCSLYRNNR